MINNLLNALQPYLPEIYFFAIALGTILLIFLALFIGRSITRTLRKKTWTRAPQPEKKKSGSLIEFLLKCKNSILEKNEKVKIFLGWVEKNEISSNFFRTIEILKTYIGAREPQYELPWYLMLGTEEAGKTTLLDNIDLELPIGKPEYEGSEALSKSGWRFFDQAIVIDLKGELLLEKDKRLSDQRSFDYVLRLFTQFRAKRPLDGIILVIPADELLSGLRFSQTEVAERAKHIYAQLWKLQATLGMKMPVYVVISKCDLIPGFREFISEISPASHQDIFGWSCPYSLEASYSSSWVHDIFHHISKSLNRIRAAIFAHNPKLLTQDQEGNFIFPIEFSQLESSLSIYLDTLFKDSSYYESFFLRGVYFCGRAPSPERGLKPFPSVLSSPIDKEERSTPWHEKVIFLRDLFEKKIFKEAALGQPIQRILVSTNRLLNSAKMILASIAILWGLGIWAAHHRLSRDIKTIMPALTQIDVSVTGLGNFTQGEEDPRRQTYLIEQSGKILSGFSGIHVVNVNSFFLPLSWFSDMNQDILECVAKGYDFIVFPSLYAGLLRKAGEIVAINAQSQSHGKRAQGVLNPLHLETFNQFNDYVAQVITLENFVASYNALTNSQNMVELGNLITYLYNKTLPGQFYQNNDYYRNALSQASGRPVELSAYKNAATEKLGVLYRLFIQDTFSLHDSFPMFEMLARKLAQLTDVSTIRTLDDVEMRVIGEQSVAVADALSGGQLGWIERNFFDPGPAFSTLINNVIQSSLLGNEIAAELSRLADTEFIKFKLALQTYQSTITGSFFETRQGQVIAAPSKGLIQFIDALSAFLNEPFMSKTQEHFLHLKTPLRKLLFWDESVLTKAVKFIEAYDDFAAKKLKAHPANLQSMMKIVGRNSVRKKVINNIAEAQIFQDEPVEDGFGQRELLHSQVQNIALATPLFVKLLGAFHDGASVVQNARLRELLVRENYGILMKIEKMLEHDTLYTSNENAFIEWDGEPMIGMKAFGVHDLQDMKAYLKAQRFQIHFLAKELAEPILTFLSLGYLEDVPIDLPLASRWTRIIGVLDDYEKQSPGNTLKVLEQFLMHDINNITLENCSTLRDKIDGFGEGDYFLDIRADIASHLLKRCHSVGTQQFFRQYNEAASFFNINLAGRFPFTPQEEKGTGAGLEADPLDVAAFFQLFDAIPQEDLPQNMSIRNREAEALKFIRDVQSVRPLMLAALNQGPEGIIPHIDVEVEFRTDRSQEKGGEKVIDWSFQIGGQEIDFRAPHPQGTWQIGSPVMVNFRWAQDAESVPIADPKKPSLSVSDLTATYSYVGPWSLIRLIKEHGVYEGDYRKASGPRPQVLKFQIPTVLSPNPERHSGIKTLPGEGRREETRVYLRLALKEPRKAAKGTNKESAAKENATHSKESAAKERTGSAAAQKATLLSIPRFPAEAPLLEPRFKARFKGA
ncbi:MAG: hypothetical protein JNK42_01615 [Caedimonas sp.]|nr:hypothetical protein [Caedimonas sp.]